jgi:methionyl-tRNA formyltransferase
MKPNVILLTTKTPHHFFFINQISKFCNLIVVFEKNILKPNFKIKHGYEKYQILYEKKKWFNNNKIKIFKDIKILNVYDINEKKTIDFIKSNNPDVIFSFGVSRLKKNFLKNIKEKIYNFHGGDTSFYRGLDSHLWSLYHNDQRGLKVTLHEVDDKLDTGNVIFIENLQLKKTNKLYQLRSVNTELCVKLAKKFLKNIKIKTKTQKKIGRYYSFMPSEIKDIINKKYIKKLKKIYYDS